MSANKSNIEFNEEEKVSNRNLNQNDSQIIKYSKDYIKKIENNKTIESNNSLRNLFKQNDVEKIKQKLKENLDSNLNSYILSTKSKEQKIVELLELTNQYESQITILNNQINLLTKNNKQMKDILKNMELNYNQKETDLMNEKELNKKNINIINELNQDKNICETKIKELVNIINQYSGQIEALTENLNNIKNEFFEYKEKNEKEKNKLNELNNMNNILNKEKEELNLIINKINEENIKLKQDNKNLFEKFNLLENDYKLLKEKNIKIENLFEKEKNKYNTLINYINQDLKSLKEYFEYKINHILIKDEYNNNILNENKLSLNCFNNDEIKKINFEIFIKELINIFNSFKEKIDINNKNYNNVYIKEINDMNKLIKIKDDNINKLKEDVKKLLQDNIILIKELEKFSNV